MKALILETKVVEIVETPFDVHPSMVWVDVPNDLILTGDWTYENGVFVEPVEVEQEVVIPSVVTMRQARLALLQQGLLSTVSAAIDSMTGDTGEAARIEWEYAATVERVSPLILSLGSALGLSDEQLDELFVLAASL